MKSTDIININKGGVPMDIVGLSMTMAQSKVQTDVGTAILGKQLDLTQEVGDGITKMMEQSVTPYLGENVDVSV